MLTRHECVRLLLAVGLTLCSGVVAAAGMRVLPLRLDINPKTRLATLELTNLASLDMGVQMDAKAWHQEAGADIYTDTQDLFFAPPIFAIPAGKTRTVRFRLKRGADLSRELAYRVYAQQIAVPPGMGDPGAAAMAGGVEVKLRFGIPLFVAAIEAKPPVLEARLVKDASGFSLRLRNSGGTHLKVFSAQVLSQSDDTVFAETQKSATDTNYLLPDNGSDWPLHQPGKAEAVALAAGTYRVRIKTDYYANPNRRDEAFGADGSLTTNLTLAP